MIWIMK